MTVKELAARIGEDALVSFEKGNVSVRCRIVDARTAYGKAQLLVQPVAGEGETWVEEARIKPAPERAQLYQCRGCERTVRVKSPPDSCPRCGGVLWNFSGYADIKQGGDASANG